MRARCKRPTQPASPLIFGGEAWGRARRSRIPELAARFSFGTPAVRLPPEGRSSENLAVSKGLRDNCPGRDRPALDGAFDKNNDVVSAPTVAPIRRPLAALGLLAGHPLGRQADDEL